MYAEDQQQQVNDRHGAERACSGSKERIEHIKTRVDEDEDEDEQTHDLFCPRAEEVCESVMFTSPET